MNELTDQTIATIKAAAQQLTGVKRRAFQARISLDYLEGNTRRAERVFGWSRQAVETGLGELRTGIVCVDNFSARGNRKTEEKQPELKDAIRAVVERQNQADPKFQSRFARTRITGESVRQMLIAEKVFLPNQLPCERTIRRILTSLGYRLPRVQKAKPIKTIAVENPAAADR